MRHPDDVAPRPPIGVAAPSPTHERSPEAGPTNTSPGPESVDAAAHREPASVVAAREFEPAAAIRDLSQGELDALLRSRAETADGVYGAAMAALDRIATSFPPAPLLAAVSLDAVLPEVDPQGAGAAVAPSPSWAEVALLQAHLLRFVPGAAGTSAPAPDSAALDQVRGALHDASRAFPARRLRQVADAGSQAERRLRVLYERIRLATQVAGRSRGSARTVDIVRRLWEPLDDQVEERRGVRATELIAMWSAITRAAYERIGGQLALRRALPAWADTLGVAARARAAFAASVPPAGVDLSGLAASSPIGDYAVELARVADTELAEMLVFTLGDFQTAYGALRGRDADDGRPDAAALRGVLDEWSLAFGDLAARNADFAFLDNPVWDQPLVRLGSDRWLLPIPRAPVHNMFELMERLIDRDEPFTKRYEDRRSDFLEEEVSSVLGRALPGAELYRGTQFRLAADPARLYENDLIAVLDSHVVVQESKSGGVKPGAERAGYVSVETTIRELVQEPARQSSRAASVVATPGVHRLPRARGGENVIDTRFVRRAIRLSVTLERLDTIGARWAELRECGLLTPDVVPAPTLTLDELQDVCAVLGSPAELLHYLGLRERIELRAREPADEHDVLALYLRTGFSASARDPLGPNERIGGMGRALLSALARQRRGEAVELPRRPRSAWWDAVIAQLELDRPRGWTLAADVILTIPGTGQEALERDAADGVREVRERDPRCEHGSPAWTTARVDLGTAERQSATVLVVPAPDVPPAEAGDRVLRAVTDLVNELLAAGSPGRDVVALAVGDPPGASARAFEFVLTLAESDISCMISERRSSK